MCMTRHHMLSAMKRERLSPFAGVVSASRTDFNPVVTDQPAQQLSSQQGAFGGRAAVAKLFGRTDTGELLPIAEVLTRSNSSSSEGDSADILSTAVDSVMIEGPESGIAEAAGLTIRIPAAAAQNAECQKWQPEVTQDVSDDVESLLTASLDNMLFGKDEGVLSEVSNKCNSCHCPLFLGTTPYFMAPPL